MDSLDRSESENGLKGFQTLGEFLVEDGWHPQQIEGKNIFRMGFAGDNGSSICYAQVLTDLEIAIFYAVAPVRVPEDRRGDIAEFITRANYGLRIGNFELDYADGEIRYKSSLDFEGVALVPALIRNALYPAARTLDRYLPGMMAVVYGGKTPAAAIEEIEGAAS